jgi:hypothetical protein
MTRRLLPICAALSLALAPAAMASDHNMRNTASTALATAA